jgi:hypothetical protein
MAGKSIFQDVHALVVCGEYSNAKAAITQRLGAHGAKIVTRLNKDVTHVVYQRRSGHNASAIAEDCDKLRALYRRIDVVSGTTQVPQSFFKWYRQRYVDTRTTISTLHLLFLQLPHAPLVVSPLWLEQSISQGRRLIETKFTVPRPRQETALTNANSHLDKKRKRGAAKSKPPKPKEAFDLNLSDFSSTQQLQTVSMQIHQKMPAPGSGVAATRRRVKRQQPRGRASQAQGFPIGQVTSKPPAEHREFDQNTALTVGAATQNVANILATDLPLIACSHEHGQQDASPDVFEDDCNDDDDDDALDTPLHLRLVRKSLDRKRQKISQSPEPLSQGHRQSRLARVSGPGAEPCRDKSRNSNIHGAIDTNTQDRHRLVAESAHVMKGKRVAQRFSLRQLGSNTARPLMLHKGTPIAAALPPPTELAKKIKPPIPVPHVNRVESPWNAAFPPLDRLSSPGSQDAEEKGGNALDADVQGLIGSVTALKSSKNTSSLDYKDRPSSFGVPAEHDRRDVQQNPEANTPWNDSVNARHSLPSPWTAQRPWDLPRRKADATENKQQMRVLRLSQQSPLLVESQRKNKNADGRRVLPGATKKAQNVKSPGGTRKGTNVVGCYGRSAASSMREERQGGATRRRNLKRKGQAVLKPQEQQDGFIVALNAVVQSPLSKDRCPPKHGVLAVTSATASITELCKSATRRLSGLRMALEGREDGTITHLIMGEPRRTLKTMLAVANGAYVLKPEWVTASIEAGKWLPEEDFEQDQEHFSAAAKRARQQRTAHGSNALLHGNCIHVVAAAGDRKAATTASVIRRVATALGAELGTARECTLCIACGNFPKKGKGRPTGVPRGAAVVQDKWLLQVAASYKLVPKKDYIIC